MLYGWGLLCSCLLCELSLGDIGVHRDKDGMTHTERVLPVFGVNGRMAAPFEYTNFLLLFQEN